MTEILICSLAAFWVGCLILGVLIGRILFRR